MEEENYLKKELYALIKKDDKIFDFLQDKFLDGLWYWDLEQPENEWMNEKFWEILGFSSEEKKHLASEWQDMIFQEDLELAMDNFNKHLLDPEHPYDQIVRYRHKKGHTVWVRCKGHIIRDENEKPIRMVGFHTNYTKMITSEIKLKSILDSSLDGIISFKPLFKNDEIIDFTLSFINEKACEINSFRERDLIGKKLSTLLPRDFIPLKSLKEKSLFQEYVEVYETGEAKIHEIFFNVNKIKEWYRVKIVKDKLDLSLSFTPITREKELEEQSLLASKGLMLEAISHQWRQPLAEINSILFKMNHLLKKEDIKNKTLICELNKIENLTDFLSNTLEDFRGNIFENAKKEIFSLNVFISNVIFLLTGSLEKKRIKIENRLKEDIYLNSYSNHLKHVLFAIMQNSIEAFKEEEKEKKIIISTEIEEKYIVISIEDNAGGIEEENILKVFEKNFTTKDKGTGIGLFISNLIVSKLLKAELEITNTDVGVKLNIKLKNTEN